MKELLNEDMLKVSGGGDPSKIGSGAISTGAGAVGAAIGGLFGGPPGAFIGGALAGAVVGSNSDAINSAVGNALTRQLQGLSVGA